MSDLRKLLGKLLEEQDIEREKSLNELNMAVAAKSAAKEADFSSGSKIASNKKADPVSVAKQSLLKAWNDINLALKDQSTKGMFDSSPDIKNILKLIKVYAQKDAVAQQKQAIQPKPVVQQKPAATPAPIAPAPQAQPAKNPGVS